MACSSHLDGNQLETQYVFGTITTLLILVAPYYGSFGDHPEGPSKVYLGMNAIELQ